MEVVKAEFVVSNATVEKCPKPDRHEYAFIHAGPASDICFYRAVECRKIIVDQYADEQ